MMFLTILNSLIIVVLVYDKIKGRFETGYSMVNKIGEFKRLTIYWRHNISYYGWSSYPLITIPAFWKGKVK